MIIFCVCAVASVVVLYSAPEEYGYIAAAGPEAKAFVRGEGGELTEAEPITRGTKVQVLREQAEGYAAVELDGEKYYVSQENVVESADETVLETTLYVRTPATIYAKSKGPAIAGFAPKGSELEIVGHTKIRKDGTVKKYRVRYGDATGDESTTADDADGDGASDESTTADDESATDDDERAAADDESAAADESAVADDESAAADEDSDGADDESGVTGYVYAKYLVSSKKKAEKNCNKNGAYDMAKDAHYGMDLHGGKATNLDYFPQEFSPIGDNEFCSDARAMYLHAGAAVSDKYFELAKESGANAVVINIDGGTLAYKSPVAEELCPTAYKDAHHSVEKYQEAVKKYNDAGFYTIGRIVAFNDPSYAADHKDACIKRGGKRTKWVSAYDRGAWEYKVKLAIEAVELMGFNEIQYDYVRFPEASYEMSVSGSTDWRNKYDEEKAEAIQNFCFYAADQIHEAGAYLSIDVFGESSLGYVTAYGQYWPAISNVVDAISSMPYTDHFGKTDTWSRPYNCMYNWAKSTLKMQKHIPTPACARTWITGYNTPNWNPTVDYDYGKLHAQVKALKDAGLDGGFIPWNSTCDYGKYKEYLKIWEP